MSMCARLSHINNPTRKAAYSRIIRFLVKKVAKHSPKSVQNNEKGDRKVKKDKKELTKGKESDRIDARSKRAESRKQAREKER